MTFLWNCANCHTDTLSLFAKKPCCPFEKKLCQFLCWTCGHKALICAAWCLQMTVDQAGNKFKQAFITENVLILIYSWSLWMQCTSKQHTLAHSHKHTPGGRTWMCVFSLLWLTLPTYAGLSQRLMEEDTPPPQVLLHSPHIDQGPQPPSTLWGQVPNVTHSPW